MKHWLRFLCLVCLLACLTAAGALAEEQLYHVESRLIADGVLPEAQPEAISKAVPKGFKEYLLPKLKALSSEIDVSRFGMSPDEFYLKYNEMLNLNPEYFYVSGGYRFYMDRGIITRLLPDYRYKLDEIPARRKNFETAVDAVVAHAQEATTPVGQLLRAHDYFCANFAYDETYSYYRPEELFSKKTGVCNAYALAYCAVLNKLGITNDLTSSEAINHIWNLVKLGGKWYHIDVTWDDPITDMPLRVGHTNFLRSDQGIMETGHYGWATSIIGNGTKYDDYFWQDVNHSLSMQGDTVYYVSNDFVHPNRTVYAFDLEKGTEKPFFQYTYKPSGGYYADYNPVWVVGDDVFYVTGYELYHANKNSGKSTLLLSTGKNTTIWGVNQQGNQLKLYAANGYNNNGKIHSYTMIVDCDIALAKHFLETKVGTKTTMKYTITPKVTIEQKVTWSFDPADLGCAKMDGNKLVALKPGLVTVKATLPNGKSDACQVLVHAAEPLCIPSGTKVIEEEAFYGVGAMEIVLPEGVVRIESGAFADCAQLRLLHLPESLAYIAEDAFNSASLKNVLVLVKTENCYAVDFAKANNIPYMVMD